MRADGYEQRQFEAQEASERAALDIERLEDEADTDDGFDYAQAAMVAHFIDRVLP